MLRGLFPLSARDILAQLELANGLGLIVQRLIVLEQETSNKGGVQRMLANHFAKVYQVRLSGAARPGPSMWIGWPVLVISPRALRGVWQVARFVRVTVFMPKLQIGAALR
jgi:hypothetical protein